MAEKVEFTDKGGNRKVMDAKSAKVLMALGRGTYATRDMQAAPVGRVPSVELPVRTATPEAPAPTPAPAPAPTPAPAPALPPVDAVPAARELLEAAGIDPRTVKGSGLNGRILKADAENAIANAK